MILLENTPINSYIEKKPTPPPLIHDILLVGLTQYPTIYKQQVALPGGANPLILYTFSFKNNHPYIIFFKL